MFIRHSQFGLSDPTGNFLFLVPLVQLVAAVIWTLQIYYISVVSLRLDIFAVDWTLRLDGALDTSSRRCIGHLVLTVHWTSHLDGAMDISYRRRFGCLGYGLDVIQGT